MQAARNEYFKKMPQTNVDNQAMQTMQKEFADIFAKNSGIFSKLEVLHTEKFKEEAAMIAEKFDPVSNNAEYLKEYNKLVLEFCPEVAEVHQEIEKVQKKYTSAA